MSVRIVAALGGNALLRRGEPLTADNQRRNIRIAADALAPLALEHELVITHGNGPQVGLLALQSAAYKADEIYPLDILDAETEGMIGYLLEQEMINHLPSDRQCATLLTQIEVDSNDPAFNNLTKPIGPVYDETEAKQLAKARNWRIAVDGEHYRRVVASPRPVRILEQRVIDLLVSQGVIVICAGGGGIPVICRENGTLAGVEAVIDKDLASTLLAREIQADLLLMLTDVDAVYQDWGKASVRAIKRISPQAIKAFSFAPGSMDPKVQAAIEFVEQRGGYACIGSLKDAAAMVKGEAGTLIGEDTVETVWWE
ncbi:MAG: carbamate kinase [Nitrosomonas sp.]|nr:carbamate kinase [Nitrosomonas sp.]